jgi:hypothetical protein
MRTLLKFARLTGSERARLLEAIAALSTASLLLKMFGFTRLSSRLGRHMAVAAPVTESGLIRAASEIRWAVEAAATRLPWKPVCLPQALAAHWMLRRRAIPSTLYLGLDAKQGYDAHAWVRVGPVVVTGGPGQDRFVVVASFA